MTKYVTYLTLHKTGSSKVIEVPNNGDILFKMEKICLCLLMLTTENGLKINTGPYWEVLFFNLNSKIFKKKLY